MTQNAWELVGLLLSPSFQNWRPFFLCYCCIVFNCLSCCSDLVHYRFTQQNTLYFPKYAFTKPEISPSVLFKSGNSSVIRQKGESQNGCFKKIKHAKFSKKRTFLTPLIRTGTCAYQGVRNVRSSENLASCVFLKHPFWDSSCM